jgi:hypothetical protein
MALAVRTERNVQLRRRPGGMSMQRKRDHVQVWVVAEEEEEEEEEEE